MYGNNSERLWLEIKNYLASTEESNISVSTEDFNKPLNLSDLLDYVQKFPSISERIKQKSNSVYESKSISLEYSKSPEFNSIEKLKNKLKKTDNKPINRTIWKNPEPNTIGIGIKEISNKIYQGGSKSHKRRIKRNLKDIINNDLKNIKL